MKKNKSPFSVLNAASTTIVVFIFALLLFSCDILRNGFFEVSGWNPGSGYHNPPPGEVTLVFSQEPDRNSVERSFSLAENGKNRPGHFFWQGNRMIFIPAAPLLANRDYLVVLKTDAQNSKGLNLERQFEAAFTTRNGRSRPLLIETIPRDGGVMIEERGRVELLFSLPMDRSSLQYLSFSPSISGAWALEEGGYRAVFTPLENWNTNRLYKLTMGTALADDLELETGEELLLHFSAGIDKTVPEFLYAFALDNSNHTAMILNPDNGAVAENGGWEKSYRLGFVFSKPVDTVSVTSALNCEPSLGMILETAPGFTDTLVYRFTDAPLYGASYTISMAKTVKDAAGNTLENKILWRIRSDGEHSRPPFLKGLRFPKDPASVLELLVYSPEDLFADFPVEGGNYTFDRGVNTWMELYFETAAGAAIDPLSLMDRFKFSATNGAVNFSPRSVELSSFTAADPHLPWKNFYRVEIRGVLTNHPYTGMVTIETGTGLKDSYGNASTEVQRFLLLK